MGIRHNSETRDFSLSTLSNVPESVLSELSDRAIDNFSRYQILLVFILSFCNGLVALSLTIPTFHGYTPDNFTCAEDSDNAPNGVCVPGCRKYDFHDTDTSIVTEWSLVCDRRYLMPLSTTLLFVGVAVGSFAGGFMGDLWGRKTVFFACLVLQGVFSASVFFAQSLTVFIILRILQGFFSQGMQNAFFTLLQEWSPKKKRPICNLLSQSFWSLGVAYVGVTAYFIRDWRLHQLATALPIFITLLWVWLVPESPRWYLTNDRKLEALKTLKRVTDKVKTEALFEEYNKLKINQELAGTNISNENVTMMNLFKNPILRKHLLVMVLAAFSANLAYYGILLYTSNLSGDRFLSFIVGAIMEPIGAVLGFLTNSSRLGRRSSQIIFLCLVGITCATLGILTFSPEDVSWKVPAVAIIGRILVMSLFSGVNLYAMELFPTVLRSSAFGIINLFSKGSVIVVPQILFLGELTHPTVPLGIIAMFLFAATVVSFVVPETRNKPLPNTLDDVQKVWGKKL